MNKGRNQKRRIYIKTQWGVREPGATVYNLSQSSLAEQMTWRLREALVDLGSEAINGVHFDNMPHGDETYVIDIDFPLLPKGGSNAWLTGALLYAHKHEADMAYTLGTEMNRWGIQTSKIWGHIKERPLPPLEPADLRIVPFFLDCVDAQIACLRLENLARRLAPVLHEQIQAKPRMKVAPERQRQPV